MANPNDMSKIRDIAPMLALVPYLEAEIAQLEHALEVKVFRQLNEGTLTPEAAFYAWQEKAAYRRLLTRFQARIRGGQSAGASLQATLDIDNAVNLPLYNHQ